LPSPFNRGSLGQASLNIVVVIGFLLLIANRMPSKTEEYNRARRACPAHAHSRPRRAFRRLLRCLVRIAITVHYSVCHRVQVTTCSRTAASSGCTTPR
jgi:hypothetical protein